MATRASTTERSLISLARTRQIRAGSRVATFFYSVCRACAGARALDSCTVRRGQQHSMESSAWHRWRCAGGANLASGWSVLRRLASPKLSWFCDPRRARRPTIGWELWRQFSVDYEPARVSRALGQLTDLLNPRLLGSEASCKYRVMPWKRQIANYKAQHVWKLGGDDDVKREIIASQAPGALEQHMAIYAESLAMYQSMRGQVMDYLRVAPDPDSGEGWREAEPARPYGCRHSAGEGLRARMAQARRMITPTTGRVARTRRIATVQERSHELQTSTHGVVGARMDRAWRIPKRTNRMLSVCIAGGQDSMYRLPPPRLRSETLPEVRVSHRRRR